jgi:hypothetical protein
MTRFCTDAKRLPSGLWSIRAGAYLPVLGAESFFVPLSREHVNAMFNIALDEAKAEAEATLKMLGAYVAGLEEK